MYMKKLIIYAIVVTLLFATIMSIYVYFKYATSANVDETWEYPLPKEGVFVCEELNLQLSCNGNDLSYNYIMIEGRKIKCSFGIKPGTMEMFIYSHENIDLQLKKGDLILKGTIAQVETDSFALFLEKEEKCYIFKRKE